MWGFVDLTRCSKTLRHTVLKAASCETELFYFSESVCKPWVIPARKSQYVTQRYMYVHQQCVRVNALKRSYMIYMRMIAFTWGGMIKIRSRKPACLLNVSHHYFINRTGLSFLPKFSAFFQILCILPSVHFDMERPSFCKKAMSHRCLPMTMHKKLII